MSPLLKIVLILFGLAYLISPADLIPELLLPWVGWLDDGVVLWSVYYLIRHGELPWFLFNRKGGKGWRTSVTGRTDGSNRGKTAPGSSRQNSTGPGTQKNRTEGSGTGRRKKETQKNTSSAVTSPKTPYEILGITPDASWDTVQKAYKEKIKQYHPDKLSHLGEEFSSLANEKFLEIQAAYNTLKKKRE